MGTFLFRRLLLTASLILALVMMLQLFDWSGIIGKIVPGVVPVKCLYDPAGVPAAPPGPDGRPANYFHTCGSRIYDSLGREVRIVGVNWSGMEYGDCAPGGLGARRWQEILDQIAALGYNTIRIPFTNEALQPARKIGGVNFDLNLDLQGLTGLEMLDRVVAGARERGLKIILDRHRPSVNGYTPLWYSQEVPEEKWISDWRMLAARYLGNDTVIGVDLSNEPRGPTTWGSGDLSTDWRLAAERAGNAVLEVNLYLLIFVEGIENYNGDHSWWGGDLQGVRSAPVRLQVPNRVVYSPHDYGPNVSAQVWFWDPTFPKNLPSEWDKRWGYIHREGIAPIVVGEFGGRSVGDDPEGQWQRALLSYLKANGLGAMIWSVNPNWDTGGIFTNDWQDIEREKQEAYQQILAPPLDLGITGVFGRAPSRFRILYRQGRDDQQSGRVIFTFRISNEGQEPFDLSRGEVRYWLKAGDVTGVALQANVDSVDPAARRVLVSLVPVYRNGQDQYLRITFSPGAGTVGAYRASNEIGISLPKTSWSKHDATADYSFAAGPEFRERFGAWDKVTFYVDDKLAWGIEP